MRNKLRNGLLGFALVVGVVLFTLSFYINDFSMQAISDSSIKKLEKAIHKKQHTLEVLSAKWISNMEHSSEPFIDSAAFTKLESTRDIILFGFKNDSLLYWSDNIPVTEERLREIDTVARYVKLGSSWHSKAQASEGEGSYVAQAYVKGPLKAVTLILVRNEYTYQNAFLKDGFNPSLPFPPSTFVATLSEGGSVISGQDGRPLFALGVDVVDSKPGLSIALRWIGFVLMLLAASLLILPDGRHAKSLLTLILYIIVLFFLRLYLLSNISLLQGSGLLFSPQLFASSDILPSLGDLLLDVIFFFLFATALYRYRISLHYYLKNLNSYISWSVALFFTAFIAIVAIGIHHIIISLVVNSQIPLEPYRLSGINLYTVLSYGIISLAFSGLFLLQLSTIQLFRLSKKKLFIATGLFLTVFLLFDKISWISFAFWLFYLLSFAVSTFYLNGKLSRLRYLVVLVLFTSLYVLLVVTVEANKKEKNERIVMALNLSAEHDPVAEALFKDISDRLNDDYLLADLVQDPAKNGQTVVARLTDSYFSGYFKRYDFSVTICPYKHILVLPEENRVVEDCWEFFDDLKQRYGGSTIGNFTFLNNNNGRISYLGKVVYPSSVYNNGVAIFIRLDSRLEKSLIGYPELLLEQNEDVGIGKQSNKAYSYAKYLNGTLVSYYGSYGYGLEQRGANEPEAVGSYFFYKSNGYSHLQMKCDENNTVIVSLPELRPSDFVLSFSYVFLLFFISIGLFMLLGGFSYSSSERRTTFKQRITIMVLAMLTLSFAATGASMLVYSMKQFNKANITGIEERMDMVFAEFDRRYAHSRSLNGESYAGITSWLVDLSNIYHSDINIYSPEGRLLATSRNDIFEKGLQGENINAQAYRKLRYDNVSRYVDKETIGNLNFYSAYTLYYNNNGEVLGFINLPYFAKQVELRKELTQLVIAVLNIFILLTVLGVFVAVAISNRLARPLETVREGMKRLDLLGSPEPIAYNGNDELGDLVREYNRVIEELADSAQRLAKTERESAWREMARQIAHEIKNPLTPMRLSIQHIMRMKRDGIAGWQDKFDDLAKSLIEQIDTLADTASEFSNFAKLAQVEHAEVNLIPLLREQHTLFAGYENIAIKLHSDTDEVWVLAHREQLQRVFTNLIKNAVQAIGDKPDGVINLHVEEQDGFYHVAVEDNGTGISEDQQRNLFRPNFTTKSGGTGLGLAISKNIVESFGGSINFSPSPSGGACFTVVLPLA